jgi:uracil phosphoribosyltransferase
VSLTIIDHPLAQHYLTHLRDETTKPATFRSLTRKITALLAIEASREISLESVTVRTPLESADCWELADEIVIVPVLRAGLGMLDAIVELFPEVSIGYFGLERDETTAVASSYYKKLPAITNRVVFLVDPMLATGGSAHRALRDIYSESPSRVVMISIVAAPEGVAMLESAFPQLQIFTAALDRQLNDRKYILPGLGDFGDRLYDTY